ncbi:unnamed protein product, partial [marine sediment metagenome]
MQNCQFGALGEANSLNYLPPLEANASVDTISRI